MSPPATVRLDRLLANMGYGSRREMQELCRSKRILLDGSAIADAGMRMTLSPDLPQRLRIDDETLDPLPGLILMLHKPLGATCSHKEAGPLVYTLLPSRWRQRDPAISTVGRLDKDSSGLLLMTDDGGLLHRIISPRRHVSKRYIVTLDRTLRGDEETIFGRGGLMLDGETKPLLPAVMETLSPISARLTLSEGRYHQVRRMFAAVGNHVTALHRDRVGGLFLPDDLAPGAFRLLEQSSIDTLFGG